MRALRIHQFGLNSLKLEQVAVPQQGPKQVIIAIRLGGISILYNLLIIWEQILVAIKAAGVNPVDVRIASGKFHSFKPPLPYIPGIDGSGVVEAIGSEVTTFKVNNIIFYCLYLIILIIFVYNTAIDNGIIWYSNFNNW